MTNPSKYYIISLNQKNQMNQRTATAALVRVKLEELDSRVVYLMINNMEKEATCICEEYHEWINCFTDGSIRDLEVVCLPDLTANI